MFAELSRINAQNRLNTTQQNLNACGLRIEEVYRDVAGHAYHPSSTEIAVVAKKSD